jgi:hydrogenase-4 component F
MNEIMLEAFAVILIPVIAGILALKEYRISSVATSAIEVLISIAIFLSGNSSGIFYINAVSKVFILMVASVYLLSTIYSMEYLEKGTWLRHSYYFLLFNFFTASMMFALTINNYGLMWVGIEATTISSAILIMTEKTEISTEATWRYILIVSAGVTFAFISIILIYYNFGTLDVSSILSRSPGNSLVLRLIVSISLVGFGTKVGIFPVHTWLPDAHSESPAPVSAMFSGVLLPTALYVVYTIYRIDEFHELYIWAGTVSVVFASIFLGSQRKYKRMFAYSTMENMSIALIGFATGTVVGIAGALLLLVAHSFGKASAFYSSGNVLKSYGEKDIERVSGVARAMPVTGSSLILSSLAVTGTPPFGTFFGEFLILYAVYSGGYIIPFVLLAIFIPVAFISVNYNVTRMAFGHESKMRENNRRMPYIALVPAIISLAVGIGFLVVTYALV